MKPIITIILALFVFSPAIPQPIDFNADKIKLVADGSFLPDADWNALFYDWKTANDENGTGFQKDFAIASDDRVIISNRSNYSVYILDKSGKLIKTFGKKGGKPGEFLYRQDFHGILDDHLLVFSDHQGRINFFDLDGNFVKMITIDFMPLNIYPIKDSRILVKGHVPMGTFARKVLAVLDYNTEKYNVFYSFDEPYKMDNKIVFSGKMGGQVSVGSGYSSQWFTRLTPSGNVISAKNNSSKVNVFSPARNSYSESGFEISIQAVPITQQDKDAYYDNFKNRLKKVGEDTTYAEQIRKESFFPEHMPYYYNILVDENNNCMFFIYNNENKDHLFKAYSTSGEYLGESEFVVEDYDLLFQANPVIIRDGYLYATALNKGATNPLRLVRFRMLPE
jgi:hypothetical protein